MGRGYTSASTIGRRAATLAEMRECLRTVRALLGGESVDFGGTPGRLTFAARRPIPLIMAASGPKAIELAGEIADGVLLLVGFNRGIVQRALGHLERGAKRAGRRVEGLEAIGARGADRRDGEARREEPLSDADADLRAAGAGDRRIPRRCVPTASGGRAQTWSLKAASTQRSRSTRSSALAAGHSRRAQATTARARVRSDVRP